jgi:hypothetical protein
LDERGGMNEARLPGIPVHHAKVVVRPGPEHASSAVGAFGCS